MTQLIKNWKELANVPANDKYKIIIDEDMCSGYIVPIEETADTISNYFKHHHYLGTHTFYGKTGTPNILKEFGWDIELANWDEMKPNNEILKVDEWFRTKNGKIGKILSVDEITLDMDEVFYETTLNEGYCDVGANDIKSHAKDVLDLIETGDIIGILRKYDNKIHYEEMYDGLLIPLADIRKIITKEKLDCVALDLDLEE